MASSFESAPQGLVAILKTTYSNATGKAGRSKLYSQLYGILWVSSALMAGNLCIQATSQSPFFFQYGGKIGTGHCEGNQPTYLFPVAVKEVTRVCFPQEQDVCFPQEQDAVSRPDTEGNGIHETLIIIQDL